MKKLKIVKVHANKFCKACNRAFASCKNKILHDESEHDIPQDKYIRDYNVARRK